MNLIIRGITQIQEITLLTWRVLRGIFRKPFYLRETVVQMDVLGVGSVTDHPPHRGRHRRGARAQLGEHAQAVRRDRGHRAAGHAEHDARDRPAARLHHARRARRLGDRGRARLDARQRADRRHAGARHRPGEEARHPAHARAGDRRPGADGDLRRGRGARRRSSSRSAS